MTDTSVHCKYSHRLSMRASKTMATVSSLMAENLSHQDSRAAYLYRQTYIIDSEIVGFEEEFFEVIHMEKKTSPRTTMSPRLTVTLCLLYPEFVAKLRRLRSVLGLLIPGSAGLT